MPILRPKIKLEKQIFSKFSFWRLFLEVKGRYLQIYQKLLIFKVFVIFKNENFAARAQKN